MTTTIGATTTAMVEGTVVAEVGDREKITTSQPRGHQKMGLFASI